MTIKLKIELNEPEFDALVKLGEIELRTPADHLRFLLRSTLIERGFLPKPTPPAPALEVKP